MDIIEIFQLKDLETVSNKLGVTLEGVNVPTMRKWSKQLCKKFQDDVRCFEICRYVIQHDVYEVRFFCALVLGLIAHKDNKYLRYLREEYCKDSNWRVQEANGKAFDSFCENYGYEISLDIIHDWLHDPNENVRRAVTEGLRIWTSKPYFNSHPQEAIDFLALMKMDESLYVRKSVANCLSDIGKAYPELVLDCFETWDLGNENTRFIVVNGCRHLKKSHPERFNTILNNRK